jgi:hypothetical protein
MERNYNLELNLYELIEIERALLNTHSDLLDAKSRDDNNDIELERINLRISTCKELINRITDLMEVANDEKH